MAKEEMFEFKHDGDHVDVVKGDGTRDIYYIKNGIRTVSAGLTYNEDTGNYTNGAGKSLTWEEAKAHIRKLL